MTMQSTLQKSRQRLILVTLMLCSLLIWLDSKVLSATLETLADPALVTGALISSLPLQQPGAGPAVTNTARRAGSVIGIVVGGTITSIAYRAAIGSALGDVPAAYRDSARISAEQARHVAATPDRPALAQAADRAFIHSVHVGATWIMPTTLIATAILVVALRPTGKKRDPTPEQDHEGACNSDPSSSARIEGSPVVGHE